MKERLKLIRRELNLTQHEAAQRLGISRSNIATYETGKSDPGDAVVSLICREFNVNEEWLRMGNGEMFVAADDTIDTVISQLKEKGYDPITIEMMKTYLSLPQDYKNVVNGVLEKFTTQRKVNVHVK